VGESVRQRIDSPFSWRAGFPFRINSPFAPPNDRMRIGKSIDPAVLFDSRAKCPGETLQLGVRKQVGQYVPQPKCGCWFGQEEMGQPVHGKVWKPIVDLSALRRRR
jgi:hypothetical protein